LLAASLAGCMTLTLRTMLGRPRPVAKVNDGFYGLLWDASYHGFPSGHSTTSVATATTLLLVAPPWVSLPVTVGAGGVLWSRMLLRQHHPADVWAGACLGFLWGILFAAGTRSLADKSPRD
jgi:undecaprenyl-diphosphatase